MSRICRLVCLLPLLAACHLPDAPPLEFKHAERPAFDAATRALDAEDVRLTYGVETLNDSSQTYVHLLILNPAAAPAAPDSLARLSRHLAYLLAADLRQPQDFRVVQVQLHTEHNYLVASTSRTQNFEYPVAELLGAH